MGGTKNAVSMDFTAQVFQQMEAVAFKVGGNLALTEGGQVVIYGQSLHGRAVAIAAVLTAKDFSYGYVVPQDEDTLVFEF